MSTLDEEAHQLWERLVDRHNACFQHGMPLPDTAEIRARYRRLIAKASSRYIRRVVRPAIVRIRPEQVEMAPVEMDQVLEFGHVVHVDQVSAIGNEIGAITAGTINAPDIQWEDITVFSPSMEAFRQALRDYRKASAANAQEPIHEWFELSYAQYLTIPRSVLQSMPTDWQAIFVALLEELDQTIEWRPSQGRYWVQLKDSQGRYVADPLMDYERGRRRIDHRTKEGQE